jgi:hypothetical protein
MKFLQSSSWSAAAWGLLISALCFTQVVTAQDDGDTIKSVPLRTHSLSQVRRNLILPLQMS